MTTFVHALHANHVATSGFENRDRKSMRLRRRVGVFAVAVLGSATTGTAQVAGPPPAPRE